MSAQPGAGTPREGGAPAFPRYELLRAVARPPLRPAAFFCAVVPPWLELERELEECDFFPPRLEAPGEFAIRAARCFDIPFFFSFSYCFSCLTLGRLPGMDDPLLRDFLDHLSGLLAACHSRNVGLRDDADELPVLLHDRQPAYLMASHQLQCLIEILLRIDRDEVFRRDVSDLCPVGILPLGDDSDRDVAVGERA